MFNSHTHLRLLTHPDEPTRLQAVEIASGPWLRWKTGFLYKTQMPVTLFDVPQACLAYTYGAGLRSRLVQSCDACRREGRGLYDRTIFDHLDEALLGLPDEFRPLLSRNVLPGRDDIAAFVAAGIGLTLYRDGVAGEKLLAQLQLNAEALEEDLRRPLGFHELKSLKDDILIVSQNLQVSGMGPPAVS